MRTYAFRYEQYARALYAALCDDPFYVAMEQSVADGSPEQAMLRYMDYSLQEGAAFGQVCIPEDHGHGASVWLKPLNHAAQEEMKAGKKRFLQEHMGWASLETYNAIVRFMARQAEPFIGPEHWYLSIVGILPQFQGRGLGPGLITGVLRTTDELGVDTYLETFSPRNISFYNRLGYQVAATILEPTTKAEYSLMTRKAQIAS